MIPYATSRIYSVSKSSSNGLAGPTVVINYSNNSGPYHFPDILIPLVILLSLNGKVLSVYSKNNNALDILYMEYTMSKSVTTALERQPQDM